MLHKVKSKGQIADFYLVRESAEKTQQGKENKKLLLFKTEFIFNNNIF